MLVLAMEFSRGRRDASDDRGSFGDEPLRTARGRPRGRALLSTEATAASGGTEVPPENGTEESPELPAGARPRSRPAKTGTARQTE
jgi:hypothetical protein